MAELLQQQHHARTLAVHPRGVVQRDHQAVHTRGEQELPQRFETLRGVVAAPQRAVEYPDGAQRQRDHAVDHRLILPHALEAAVFGVGKIVVSFHGCRKQYSPRNTIGKAVAPCRHRRRVVA